MIPVIFILGTVLAVIAVTGIISILIGIGTGRIEV